MDWINTDHERLAVVNMVLNVLVQRKVRNRHPSACDGQIESKQQFILTTVKSMTQKSMNTITHSDLFIYLFLLSLYECVIRRKKNCFTPLGVSLSALFVRIWNKIAALRNL